MSSSFRKLAPRREHKERSQPASRTRFGLLEKKKDYILRARDYQSKRKRVMALREKARLRNPDEYYFAMNSSTTKDGIHQASRNDINWTPDMVALMKSQDLSYITTVKTINRKKLEKLNETYPHLLSAKESGSPQYIKFDTNPLEQSKEPVVREPTVHIGFAKTKASTLNATIVQHSGVPHDMLDSMGAPMFVGMN